MSRKFCYFGPVDPLFHYAVERTELIESCCRQLVGYTQKDDAGATKDKGHYFTVWAPRQSGKTWIMRQVRIPLKSATQSDRNLPPVPAES